MLSRVYVGFVDGSLAGAKSYSELSAKCRTSELQCQHVALILLQRFWRRLWSSGYLTQDVTGGCAYSTYLQQILYKLISVERITRDGVPKDTIPNCICANHFDHTSRLMEAVKNRRVEVIKQLLDMGVDVNAATEDVSCGVLCEKFISKARLTEPYERYFCR